MYDMFVSILNRCFVVGGGGGIVIVIFWHNIVLFTKATDTSFSHNHGMEDEVMDSRPTRCVEFTT